MKLSAFGTTVFFIAAQVLGAACLIVVVLAHVCEALNLFPSMRWGAGDSVGHYVAFVSTVLGLFLFRIGYLFHARAKRASNET